jgi:hypothetical protein
MFPIPWFAVIFISIPQTFLIIMIGFKLFNIKIKLKDAIAAAVLVSIIAYFLRRLSIPPGSHTIILAICLTAVITILSRINIWYSCISVLLGAMILGVLENAVMPIILFFISKTVNDLALNPWLNIEVFLPTLLLSALIFCLIKKYDLVLYDLGAREIS